MKNDTHNLSEYKQILKKLKITHKEVAQYTGQTRENITTLLNGKRTTKLKTAHISDEIEELIGIHKFNSNNQKNKKLNVFDNLQQKINALSKDINNIKKELILKYEI